MLKRNLLRASAMVLLSLVLLVCSTFPQSRRVTVAFRDLPNIFVATQNFQLGFVLPGTTSGAVTITAPASINNYAFSLPSGGGQSGFYLCVNSTLAHCANSTGIGAPLFNTNPPTIVFPMTTVGSTSTGSTIITDVGNDVYTFAPAAFVFTGTAAFKISTVHSSTCISSGNVQAGASCTLFVDFTPSATGQNSGTVVISDNATGSPHTVSLLGLGQ